MKHIVKWGDKMKPLIGILGRSESSETGMPLISVQEKERIAIIQAGGVPFLILPPQQVEYRKEKPCDMKGMTEEEKEILDQQISLVDGILLPGGDISYEYDRYIVLQAIKKDIPLLGICMGMQVMTFYNQNSNLQRIEHSNLHFNKHKKYAHMIIIDENSKLYQILKQEKIKVNSIHHYETKKSDTFHVKAISEDGVIEAIEYPKCHFCIGVQFHPELMIEFDENSRKLFDAFINESLLYHKRHI